MDQVQGNTKSSRKYWVGLIAVLLVAILGIGASFAYLVAQKQIENVFSLDTNLAIELTEPSFVKEDAKDMVPAQKIAKDPTVSNTGSVDAYIAASVKVPVFSGNYLNSDNKVVVANNKDLFSYGLGEGWTEIGTPVVKDGFSTHTYVYNTELKATQSATPIFDEIALMNLTESVGITDTSVDVTAYAIQSHGFSSPEEAYAAYLAQSVDAVVADDVDGN